jgi:hypothetical protein
MRSHPEDGTMAVDEAARHQLYTSLEAALGPEPTSTLMSLLPPVGWADVATKQDLIGLENALRVEMADLRTEIHKEIGGLRTEIHTTVRSALFSMIGAMFALAALTWAAVSLT